MGISVYFAACYSDRNTIAKYATQLRNRSINVKSRWLTNVEGQNNATFDDWTKWAAEDIEDIYQTSLTVFFTHEGTCHGGRFVELGISLALGHIVFIIGPRENVFSYSPGIQQFECWQDFLRYIDDGQLDIDEPSAMVNTQF